MAQPQQALTLTGLPRVWQQAQKLMGRFRRALTRRGLRGEYAFHLEPNPSDDRGAHCHAWWRGERLSQSVLSEVAQVSGMGSVAFEKQAEIASLDYAVATVDYGMKSVLRDRPEHPDAMWPAAATFLELNGDKLVHATNGFWRDWLLQPLDLRMARSIAHNWRWRRGGSPASAAI